MTWTMHHLLTSWLRPRRLLNPNRHPPSRGNLCGSPLRPHNLGLPRSIQCVLYLYPLIDRYLPLLLSAPGEAPCICPTNPAEHVAPSFLRPVPKPSDSVSYEPLPRPFVIDAKPGAVELSKSFAPWDIPALHKHDVQKEDWQQLLGDVQACAKLSSGQRIVSGALPVTRHLGPPGHIASFLVEQGMKKQKTTDVAAILDLWNQRFFHPRREQIRCICL